MISERQFAQGFGSFWSQLLPASDRFIRKMNVGREKFGDEVSNAASPEKRGLINESAYLVAKWAYRNEVSRPLTASKIASALPSALDQASRKIAAIERTNPPDLAPSTELEETREIVELADNIVFFVDHMGWHRLEVEFAPIFAGCGFVEACIGNLLARDTIVEIKAGDRAFRSVDLRQTLVYAALRYASGGSIVRSIVLVNPRNGMYSNLPFQALCVSLGGESAEAVLRQIVHFSCGVNLSR